jgi:hypothetical protein
VPKKPQPRVSFVVPADTHKIGAQSKVDCFGVFTTMGVWGLPALRECSVVFGLNNVPAGETTLSLWLRPSGRDVHRLADMKLESPASVVSTVNAFRAPFSLKASGAHDIGVGVGKSSLKAGWATVFINVLPWPELPQGVELARALADPHTIKSTRAVVGCQNCSAEYIFQVNLDPSVPLPKGSLAFPTDGRFACKKCKTIHHLRDIEGQLRFQLGRSTTGE